MRTSHLTDALLTELDASMKPRGFVRRQRTQSFRRDEGSHCSWFHVSFIRHDDDVDVTADVSISHYAIEETLNHNRHDLSAREKRLTSTIGVELGNLLGIGNKRWTLTQVADVPGVSADILDWFGRIGEPWLSRFGSLDET